ncbi:hypothetical protein NCS52_01031500 [Fusarium sp. LHS14.1]|nr:hypothetical protein NCS52_01031500 [Fusarium sp. LHS14.1]
MSQSATACGGPSCRMITADNACDTFPDLPVTPTPEPNPRDEEAHAAWRAGYQYWGQVRCPCGNGYFCRRHAIWIPGSEVTDGTARPREEEGNNSCPPSHDTQPSEEEHGAAATEAWSADQSVLQYDDYGRDAPGTSSSSNRRRSTTTREAGRSSNRRSHRRRRSDREPTAAGRSSRQTEYDNPVDYAGSYTQQEDQQQSPDSVIGSSTSWTSSPYPTTSTYPSSSANPTSSSYQAWYSSGQASTYNQSHLNDEPAETATPSTYDADYDTYGLSGRMGSMTIQGDSYLQDDAGGSSRYLQQQEEDDNVPEDPVSPASHGQRRKNHKRRSSKR